MKVEMDQKYKKEKGKENKREKKRASSSKISHVLALFLYLSSSAVPCPRHGLHIVCKALRAEILSW